MNIQLFSKFTPTQVNKACSNVVLTLGNDANTAIRICKIEVVEVNKNIVVRAYCPQKPGMIKLIEKFDFLGNGDSGGVLRILNLD